MVKTVDEMISTLPKKRQKKIQGMTSELIAEELVLQELRKAMKMTQEDLASALNMKQGNLSRLEKRSDLMLSTLRKYVEAVGGELELKVKFPDRPPVALSGFSEITDRV